jgi:glucose/arabinose dehydrogenase
MKQVVPSFLTIALTVSTNFLFAETVKLPPPYATPSVKNPPKVIAKPTESNLVVPDGFQVEEFASGFQKPRQMLALPGGEVLVVDSVAKGSVFLIGKDRSKKDLLSNLERPFGIAWHNGFLYVSEAQAIKKYAFDPKTFMIGPGKQVVDLEGYNKGHWSRGIAIDAKANKLYVSIGSGSNLDLGDPLDRAAVNRYNLDGSKPEVVATGLRNPVSIRFQPQSKVLWTTVQERDGLGDELVPDFFTSVRQGAFYGWPYAYVGPNEEPTHKGVAPEMVTKTIAPDVLLPAHCAVMDFIFYTGKAFPSKYRNGAFLAYHGSNNRSDRVGYEVAFVPFKNGKPAGSPETFLRGWMLGKDKAEVWGRPTGFAQMADGSLLVSEDGNNRIYRISAKK